MQVFTTAVGASEGIAIGRAYVVKRQAITSMRPCGSTEEELALFTKALELSRTQIESFAADSDIFAAHLEIVDDPMLSEAVEAHIAEGQRADDAVRSACEELVAMFAAIDDDYLAARADDIKDIFARIGANLVGAESNPFQGVEDGDIIVDNELLPSDMALLDLEKIGGFITAYGSSTSHICIIARNHSLAAVVGLGGAVEQIATGDRVIVDGTEGLVVLNPDQAMLDKYLIKGLNIEALHAEQQAVAHSSVTYDGKEVKVFANAGSVEEVERAIATGADGIGLFRSEFLYMHSTTEPDEQQQYEAYAAAARACGERVLTIRTLDIGGDKAVPYLEFDSEPNPFLGWRAIRVSLECRQMFRRQLRAILRASAVGNVRIMFPMITTISELEAAKAEVEICKAELQEQGLAYNENIEIGVMIETPAAVFIADRLAAHCNFFSIGTNDLVQYIMAADRANAKVSRLYDPYSEAVCRAISQTIAAAKSADIECGMCGELASDSAATQMLANMGLREFSVNIGAIAKIKYTISKLYKHSANL